MKIKGVTKTGFKYSIDESSLNNYELIEIIAEIDTNPLLLPKVLKLLLGEKQTDKLKDHIRQKNGTVPIELIEKELVDIFNGNKDIKNS